TGPVTAGTVARSIAKTISGAYSTAAALTKTTGHSVTAAFGAFSSSATNQISKFFTGTSATSGLVTRAVSKSISATQSAWAGTIATGHMFVVLLSAAPAALTGAISRLVGL